MKKEKKTNTKNILIAIDTETQLLKDDTPLITFKEKINKSIRQETEKFRKGVISRQELKNELKELTKILDTGVELFKKEGVEECNQILTYALGFLELVTPVRFTKKDFGHHKEAYENHKNHDEDFYTCDICSKKCVDDVKVLLDLDNKNNVWKQFFDYVENEKRYIKAKTGNTHKIKVYIHNLKFDACSLLEYLVEEQNEGNCLITNVIIKDNAYYSIAFILNGYVYEFCDSLKIIVQPLAKAGSLVNIRKTTEDATYTFFDLHDKKILDKEISYLKFDVLILNRLIYFIKKNLSVNKLTSASYAFSKLKQQVFIDDKIYKRNYWEKIFKPSFSIDDDKYIRKGYFGGITLVMPNKENKIFSGIGFSFDANSEYPASMLEDYVNPESRQYGNKFLMKKIFSKKDDFAKMAFYRIHIKKMRLKKNAVPCFPKKTSRFSYGGYILSLEDLKNNVAVLSGIDLMHIVKNYFISYDFVDGIYFTEILKKPFFQFVINNSKLKEEATKAGNKALKLVAKLNLNSCYGKLAERWNNETSIIDFDEKNETFKISKEIDEDKEWKSKGNIVLGALITAKARNILLSEMEKLNDSNIFNVTYCDTDSIHGMYTGKYLKQLESIRDEIRRGKKVSKEKRNDLFKKVCHELNLKFDEAKLGYFKAEGFFDMAIWLGPKRYFEADLVEGDNFKIAGVQESGKEYVKNLGIEKFRYSSEKELIVPFTKTVRVSGGYKFIDTYKILTTNALYTI